SVPSPKGLPHQRVPRPSPHRRPSFVETQPGHRGPAAEPKKTPIEEIIVGGRPFSPRFRHVTIVAKNDDRSHERRAHDSVGNLCGGSGFMKPAPTSFNAAGSRRAHRESPAR